LVIGDWRLVIGDWRLVIAGWRLATVYCWLPVGDCRLAIEKVVLELPLLSIGPAARVKREPEIRNPESGISNLESGI
jgi:hypothetical protein